MTYVRISALAVLALLVSGCVRDNRVHDDCPALCENENAPAITAFTAEPETVAPGDASTLTWTVSGANPTLTMTADDLRPITVTGETSYVARPTVTTTYVLIAENAAGVDQDEVTVSVGPADTAN